jgi:hypothetical protein
METIECTHGAGELTDAQLDQVTGGTYVTAAQAYWLWQNVMDGCEALYDGFSAVLSCKLYGP